MTTLKGTKGADTTTLLAGATININTITALAGNDIVVMGGFTGKVQAAYGGSGNDTLTGFNAAERLYGDVGNDSIIGSGGQDSLYGGVGNDTISVAVGTGHSVLVGYSGNDSLTGGNATTSSAADVAAVAAGKFLTQFLYGGDGNDTIAGGVGLATDNHALWGGTGNDSITAASGAGRSHIYGEAGTDALVGSTAGKDTMTGGAGADTITGGAGNANNETVSYLLSASAVTVNLALATAQTGGTGDSLGDVITVVNDSIGSKYADFLTGNLNANDILGGLGNDSIDSGGTSTSGAAGSANTGNDGLFGGYGNDTIFMHNGTNTTDTISGGANTDTVDFSNVFGAVTADLSLGTFSGAAGVGTIVTVEKLIGTISGDTLTAVGGSTVSGGLGADTIFSATSGGGKDILIGGAGADRYDGTSTTITDYFEVNRAGGVDQIFGYNAGGLSTDKLYVSIADLAPTGLASVLALGTAGAANTTSDVGTGVANLIMGTYNSLGKLASYSLHATDVISGAALTAASATTAAHAQFMFNTTTGALFYDTDGLGGLAGAQIATIDPATAGAAHGLSVLDSTDFIVVA